MKSHKCFYLWGFLTTGDKLLPQDEAEEDDSPYPTLEEVETMAAEPIYARRKKVTASYLLASQHGSEDDILYEERDASSENNREDDFTGSDDNFLGFYDE